MEVSDSLSFIIVIALFIISIFRKNNHKKKKTQVEEQNKRWSSKPQPHPISSNPDVSGLEKRQQKEAQKQKKNSKDIGHLHSSIESRHFETSIKALKTSQLLSEDMAKLKVDRFYEKRRKRKSPIQKLVRQAGKGKGLVLLSEIIRSPKFF